MSGRELLIYLSIKYEGDFERILKAIKAKEDATEEMVKKEVATIKSNVITIIDKEYPEELKHINMPPLVLYYYGDISLLNSKMRLAVVGSREASEYGIKMTKSIVQDIANKVTVVSGLARGIDAIAHKTVIDNHGRTIGILGCGIDYVYPKENDGLYTTIKKNHLLLSEYPNLTKPKPDYFPMRNRIIAGVAQKVLVTEAYKNSGTNITVLFALKQGKDVLAVPYPADANSSANKLIQDGAFLVETGEEVLYLMK